MAVTHIRRMHYDDSPPEPFSGIGALGWAAVFVIFAVAILLVAYI